ncbi:hypothetical protein SAMN05445756_0910 [Kytococcus aerolatus]|uniref:Uncharacterized protein n=1 Tax=Kytococcus aerolatus TaxID=592308 RepID=A0A212TBN5_9MICO|nr:hypothetical protein [Kytococcus aerolatus]SNC63458.1 hypothetical protein SAMN05445756_0910 [Kytococcus aerolatus]
MKKAAGGLLVAVGALWILVNCLLQLGRVGNPDVAGGPNLFDAAAWAGNTAYRAGGLVAFLLLGLGVLLVWLGVRLLRGPRRRGGGY